MRSQGSAHARKTPLLLRTVTTSLWPVNGAGPIVARAGQKVIAIRAQATGSGRVMTKIPMAPSTPATSIASHQSGLAVRKNMAKPSAMPPSE